MTVLEQPIANLSRTPKTSGAARPGAQANSNVHRFVHEAVKLCRPDQICWCNGSENERRMLLKQAVDEGVLTPLDQKKLPGCYLHRSNPNDVARSEHLTFICTPTSTGALSSRSICA